MAQHLLNALKLTKKASFKTEEPRAKQSTAFLFMQIFLKILE